ncbi:H(+)-transporting V1 sector ATPase subunit D [Aspergillus nidulans FGSC A4]|uniref:Vacuolar ATP synthase subunit D, putative (AFU_orthologue AFUA_5G11920) n=1 Tax=Emericella nidulans (strain FGSC A4 / ATCC 38163 / CBS 112.46 / NRRL 194 / M139) TaxID=227321 RepID=C8VQL6_EMENI|nr:H(+)-transporting V1 sector ATPase subunit D [Aspergillus nidulans FGSC A4]CBF90181.1 TPA: vacuolar ATP synthase subunit D, putative (AFU_orthologue; AFUA_5G11920) [Aspergillus nidulans FGSC A4]
MSGAVGREAVFPTRQSLGLMKSKLKGAETGHSLLKRKSEALTKRFREITRRIDEAKQKMGRVMQVAAFSLAEVSYAVGGDIGYQVQESAKQARFRVRAKQDNVSGVLLPHFESYTEESINDFGLTGLGKGGQQVQRCRETYARAVETLVELASLQTAFVILDEVIKVVNRRACNHPAHRKHHQIHQFRTRRARQGGVLPTQESLRQEAKRRCSSRC